MCDPNACSSSTLIHHPNFIGIPWIKIEFCFSIDYTLQMLKVFQFFISILHCSHLLISIFKFSIFICIYKIEQDPILFHNSQNRH
ncbi:hypothetical protein HanXRQr2_Chr13g0569581 [Helianthus annuus]|uniref:Uncharacterized protein n=1 Tax=Helianthus annuus TaxID=4232 RepID=A0A9K3EDG2_HELAN|nr:hypothetical protein HanXRQr2_Chr13g0569581 [Helianthus annuus]